MSQRLKSIDVLKAAACLMIINSHCSGLYPSDLMALGGGQGNAIFLVISGILCGQVKGSASHWLLKRYMRLIPVTILVCAIDFAILWTQAVTIDNVYVYYLNKFWFVWALLVYYVPFYFIFSKGSLAVVKNVGLLYLIGYILFYFGNLSEGYFFVEAEGFSPFKVYFYFLPMFLGGVVGRFGILSRIRRFIKTEGGEHRASQVDLLLSLAGFGLLVWATEYALIKVFSIGYSCQTLINIGNLLFGLSIVLAVSLGFARNLISRLGSLEVVRQISDCTLEIYLIQIAVKPLCLSLPIPVNAISFFLISIFSGVILHGLVNRFLWPLCEKVTGRI